MQHGREPEFEPPAMMRLPQVPPLKVPARRHTQFIVPPARTRYSHTEQVSVAPLLKPLATDDLFMPLPVTPPVTTQHQRWERTPYPTNLSMPGTPFGEFVPARTRNREVSNGEVLLGCAFLMLAGVIALVLLVYISSAR